MKRGLVIGITGGVGTGKSTTLDMFKKLGTETLDADAIYHQLIRPGRLGWKAIVKAFGREMLRSDHTVDRARLGMIVFKEPKKRKLLEKITHPLVRKEIDRKVALIQRLNPKLMVAVEIPLLVEAKVFKQVDVIVVVDASRKTQLNRLQQKYRWMTKSQLLRIINNQLPMSAKRQHADIIIKNDGPTAETLRQVKLAWKKFSEIS